MTNKEVYDFAHKHMKKWRVIEKGWSFIINPRPKQRLGLCNFTRKTIEISMWVVKSGDKDQIKDTILHELAHALAGEDGDTGHGEIWKAWCEEVGCNPKRCYDGETDNNLHKPRWKAKCKSCGKEFFMYREPKYKTRVCLCYKNKRTPKLDSYINYKRVKS